MSPMTNLPASLWLVSSSPQIRQLINALLVTFTTTQWRQVQEYVSGQCYIIRNDDIVAIFVWKSSLDERFDCFFLSQDFAILSVSVEAVISCLFFDSRKRAKLTKKLLECHLISYLLLTQLTCANRAGGYCTVLAACTRSLLSRARPRDNIPYYYIRPMKQQVSYRMKTWYLHGWKWHDAFFF